MKFLRAYLALLVIGISSISCTTTAPTTGTGTQTEIKSGAEVDVKFLQSFEPEIKPGMKYTYITSVPEFPQLAAEENSEEYLSVDGENVKVRLTSSKGSEEKIMKISELKSGGTSQEKYKFVGIEDVKVPAGDYKGATKVTGNLQAKPTTFWFVKNIGLVKTSTPISTPTAQGEVASTIVTELKEFKN